MNNFNVARFLRSLAQDIVKYCRKQGEEVAESLAIFMVRLVALDSSKQGILKEESPKELIHEVKLICCSRLLAKYNPSTATIKMQIYFDLNFRAQEEYIRLHRQLQEVKIAPTLLSISTKPCYTEIEMLNTYNEIILYLILKAGMGDPSSSGVYMETKNALSSLFSLSAMPQFVRKSRKEKREFIEELCPVISGLRLYSWHQGKGGFGIQNASETLRETTPRFNHRLYLELTAAEALIEKLQRILQYHAIEKPQTRRSINSSNEKDLEALSFWKSLLACTLQYQHFISIIKEESDALNIRVCDLECRFRMCISQLNTVLKTSSTFSVNRTFPLYKYLADVWKCMQEEVLLLSSYSKVTQALRKFSEQAMALTDEEEITALLNMKEEAPPEVNNLLKEIWPQYESASSVDSIVPINAESEGLQDTGMQITSAESEVLQDTSMQISTNPDKDDTPKEVSKYLDKNNSLDISLFGQGISLPADSSIYLIFPEKVKNFEKISLHCQGFCIWALVTGKGVLLPARREIGIVAYNNLFYGFCSKEAAVMFLQNPRLYAEEVFEVAREKPELILLLQLQDYFDIPLMCSKMQSSTVNPVFISDISTQTILHPVEKMIDVTYRWNQWDLRRLALKYVDMLNKKTHSTQTDLSHFRRENHSQVWLPKNNWSQTKRDGSTTMPKAGVPELLRKVRKSIL